MAPTPCEVSGAPDPTRTESALGRKSWRREMSLTRLWVAPESSRIDGREKMEEVLDECRVM